jgi:sulfotransferase
MPPLEAQQALKCKTALGRFKCFIDDGQSVGRAYNAIRDAVTRGWKPQTHFVEYNQLTSSPKETLVSVHRLDAGINCDRT